MRRFKMRYYIVGRALFGESEATDGENANKWIAEKWCGITARSRPENIYDADKTVLFWKMLPNNVDVIDAIIKSLLLLYRILRISNHFNIPSIFIYPWFHLDVFFQQARWFCHANAT